MSARYFPDADRFAQLSQQAAIVPVYRRLLSDRLTPVSAFVALQQTGDAFLLESVIGGEKIGRYSFIATNPSLTWQVHEGRVRQEDASGVTETTTTDPLADLQQLMPQGLYARDPDLPTFTGGLVGYAGYETIRYYESEKLTDRPTDDRGAPDLYFGLYNEIVAFDHVDKTIKVIANAHVKDGVDPQAAYADACRRIDALVERLHAPVTLSVGDIDPRRALDLSWDSNFTREGFEDAVRRGKEYIKAGDIFQFVPSQRLRVQSKASPIDVYRALRIINPSPYMFCLKTPKATLVGSSPEILCRVEDGLVHSRPLAGTRRRGATGAEDAALETELLADPKERAEHIMLVDLHRNDVGRVSKIGTVKISDVMTVERYSHVMHITTHVEGQLAPEFSALDALRVSLPVGTVSGAPKIRAMQIIDELEPTLRGPYGGAVGYLDFSGNLDTCIALRTIVHHGEVFDVQVGAGVVADSDPPTEFEETMNKAQALLRAVQLAEAGL